MISHLAGKSREITDERDDSLLLVSVMDIIMIDAVSAGGKAGFQARL